MFRGLWNPGDRPVRIPRRVRPSEACAPRQERVLMMIEQDQFFRVRLGERAAQAGANQPPAPVTRMRAAPSEVVIVAISGDRSGRSSRTSLFSSVTLTRLSE